VKSARAPAVAEREAVPLPVLADVPLHAHVLPRPRAGVADRQVALLEARADVEGVDHEHAAGRTGVPLAGGFDGYRVARRG
jgi:hypothetical protein